MAQDDIYGNKQKYELFVKEYETTLLKPTEGNPEAVGTRKYFCKNKENLKYVKALIKKCEARDVSYIRRLKLISCFKLVLNATEKDLQTLDQNDIDDIIIVMRKNYKKVTSQADFMKDLKCIWRWLFPETDSKGRLDASICPYAVRHLNTKIDPSKVQRKKNKIYPNEFDKIIKYYADDKSLIAFLSLAVESKARPQELLSVRLKNVTIYENFARIMIEDNKKEQGGLAKCMKSFPHILNWYKVHPFTKDPEAFLFLNQTLTQMKVPAVNKCLRIACNKLGIQRITSYSLKHAGVTWDMLSGKDVGSIQADTRWKSLRQLSTYNEMSQEDSFIMERIRAGDLKDKKVIEKYSAFLNKKEIPQKRCFVCDIPIPENANLCPQCNRPTNMEEIKKEFKEITETQNRLETLEKALKRVIFLVESNREGELKKHIQEAPSPSKSLGATLD